MTTVKFDKSVKYKGVRYAAHQVFKVDDEDVAKLKEAGATVLSTDTPPAPPQTEPPASGEGEVAEGGESTEDSADEDVAKLKEALLDYTVPELTQFAKDNDIDLQGKTKKADIYNIIVASLN